MNVIIVLGRVLRFLTAIVLIFVSIIQAVVANILCTMPGVDAEMADRIQVLMVTGVVVSCMAAAALLCTGNRTHNAATPEAPEKKGKGDKYARRSGF